ncbi:MAG TPA: PH domain-containing protein [Ktedonobacteraceae bacterium]|jgi:membrane protein YdbS with pleckstrin-like domain|nr:PH domain-containing protein [Ktedonobacteraceae bacterium]
MADKSKGKADQRSLRRSFFSMQQIRRGRDGKWHFYGQEDGEEVRLVVHKYWLFLVRPALPFVLSLLVLAGVLWIHAIFPSSLGALWWFVDGVILLFVLILGGYFIYKDGFVWWNDCYIITNKRVVKYEGFLNPKRQVVPLEKIQQIGIEFKEPWGYILRYGLIHMYLAGSDFYIQDIADPRKIRDAIEGVTKEFKASKPKEAPVARPKDPVIAGALEKLAKPKDVPKLENEDEERYGPPRDSAARLRPRRTFGWILNIPCEVRYTSGEQTVKYVQRSRWVLLAREALPILLFVLVLVVTFIVPNTGTLSGGLWRVWQYLLYFAVPGLFLWAAIIWINYVDDVYILTSKRIIDIERSYVIFSQKRIEIEYKNIKDIKVKVPGLLGIILNIGTVSVETPGTNPDIIFDYVHDPFKLQDKINEIKDFGEKAKKIKDENEQKQNLDKWFSMVLADVQSTVETRGVPDLRGKDLSAAIAIAQEYELDVTINPDVMETTEVPPGCVFVQNPPRGTIMHKGSTIEVMLGKKPVLP